MSVLGHKTTYLCAEHQKTARATGWACVEGRAPCCPTCGLPMVIHDLHTFLPSFQRLARETRDNQINRRAAEKAFQQVKND